MYYDGAIRGWQHFSNAAPSVIESHAADGFRDIMICKEQDRRERASEMNEKAIIETVTVAQPKLSREDLLQVLKYRYATKAWDRDRKISDADMETILEAARLAPTSFGFEPWKIIVLQDEEIRQAIRPYAWGADAALQDASHFLVFLARKKADITFGSPYLEHITHDIMELPEQAYEMFQAAYTGFCRDQHKILESERSAFDWSAKQAYIVMANVLFAAAYLGVDSCPVEGFTKDKVESVLTDTYHLYDPEHFGVACMAALGYRGEAPHRDKRRRPLEESVIWK